MLCFVVLLYSLVLKHSVLLGEVVCVWFSVGFSVGLFLGGGLVFVELVLKVNSVML